MKYLSILFLFSSLLVFASVDTDRDGYEDDVDRCPYVAGTSLHEGCPDIEVFQGIRSEIQILQKHACYKEVAITTGYIYGTPICASGETCASIRRNDSFRMCDIIFPVILSSDDNSPVKRGPVYFLQNK